MNTVSGPRSAAHDETDPFDDASDTFRAERTPPCNLDAEQVVLGGMMLSRSAIGDVVEALAPYGRSAFYKPAHTTIYDAALDLYGKNVAVNPITLGAELDKRGELAKAGGASYLHALVQSVPTAANAEYEAGIVLEKAKLRRLVEFGVAATQMGNAGLGDADDIIDRVSADLASITQTAVSNGDGITLADMFAKVVDKAQKDATEGTQYGVLTGLTDLDGLTHGLHPGQMIVIAARPAMGKTTLAIDIARNAAIKEEKRVAMFSLEMGDIELGQRIVAAEARVALHHITGGTVNEEDWTRIGAAAERLSNDRLRVFESGEITMTSIKAQCRRMQAREGLDLVIIDYLQLMKGSGRAESRQVEVSDMSRNAKLMAKELGVPVIVLSQLNRGPEQRSDHKPVVSDLRESGSIEQDADMVILLHREDAYEKESPRAGEADLIVAKHRNGPTAVVTVAFQGHYSRFVDMAKD